MDNSLLTKCPHCKTLFRIQQDHLAVADGEVRCGVCFKVFNATSEGISYAGEDGTSQPETHSSQEQAAEIFQKLDVPASEKEKTEKTAEAPDQEDISQLVINDESVEQLFAANETRRFERPLLWGSLCTLMVSLLVAQWLWFNMDQFSLNPEWRPWYVSACEYLGCEPTKFIALEKINTDRLTIKSHADYSNVLVVDLIISNRAQLPQPMPALDLAFYDINGDTLSSRLLQPLEYLDKSISIKHMPVNTPIHLSFAIMDPGETAVNYGVQLFETVN